MSGQTTIGNTKFFRPEWIDSQDTTRFIERNLLVGDVLNFPCGQSILGDIRADIDPSVNPDVIGDIEDPPFSNAAFDTVYCDPPYSMHAFDRNQWALRLWDVADTRLILQTTTQSYRMPNATRRVFIADPQRASPFQIFQVFDRRDRDLGDFGWMPDNGGAD